METLKKSVFYFAALLHLSFQYSINVPVMSPTCHKIISGLQEGNVSSHDRFPEAPYPTGMQCRFVINVPVGRTVEAFIENGTVGLRPWDFAIILDGSVADKLHFMCDVERYKGLGNSGTHYKAIVQKYMHAGLTRSLVSNTSTIVVDFCVHTFTKDLDNRKGFSIYYKSIPASSASKAPQTTISASVQPGDAPSSITLSATDRDFTFDKSTCGRPQNPPSNNPNYNHRIVNGVTAKENSWPWICSLVQKPTLQFCGCTLIAAQWVLTAGHCVDSSGIEFVKHNVLVFVGIENLRAATDANKYRVTHVFKHEDYNIPVGSTSNDIALLKLDRPVPISSDAMPACLPANTVHTRPYVQVGSKGRRVCYVAGWGRLYETQTGDEGGKIGAGTDALQQVAIQVMSASDCRAFMSGYTITEKMFCGGYDNGMYDSCQGDSGGPLVCDDGSGRWSLYGVVSWGLGCANAHSPGIYTEVALMKEWINTKISQNVS